jgi:hypothetical protein
MQLEGQELRLSIKPGSDPIAGRIGRPGGSQTPFEGYMQLVAALEELRETGPGGQGDPPVPGLDGEGGRRDQDGSG